MTATRSIPAACSTRRRRLAVAAAVVAASTVTGCASSPVGVTTTVPSTATTQGPAATSSTPAGTGATPSSSDPTGATPGAPVRGGAPDPDGVDRSSPDSVGEAFVQLAWTSDTRADRSPTDATARAAALATPELAADLRQDGGRRPSGDWTTWTTRKAWTQVTLTPNLDAGRPTDTATRAVRGWQARVVPRADGWTGTPQTFVVFVSLTRDSDRWSVSDLEVSS